MAQTNYTYVPGEPCDPSPEYADELTFEDLQRQAFHNGRAFSIRATRNYLEQMQKEHGNEVKTVESVCQKIIDWLNWNMDDEKDEEEGGSEYGYNPYQE